MVAPTWEEALRLLELALQQRSVLAQRMTEEGIATLDALNAIKGRLQGSCPERRLARGLENVEEQLGKLTAAVSSTLASSNNASSLLHDAQRVAAATNFAQGCIKLAGQAWALPAPGAGNPAEQSPGGFSQRAMLRLTAGALRLLMGPGRQLVLHPALHGGVGVAWLPYLLMG